MAYPVINYNSTGDSANPSDAVASSVTTSQTVSGTGGTSTITFSAAVDLSTNNGGVADDDSDFIWVNTVSGDRHLFRIVSFTGTLASCTAVTVDEAIDTTFSALAWHINGTRDDLDPDNSNGEYMDWGRGWTAVLDGSFTVGNQFEPGGNLSSSDNTADSPPITIKASASASSKPTITGPSWSFMMDINSYISVKCIDIKFSRTGSEGGGNSFVRVNEGALTMINCDVVNTSTTQPTNLIEVVASGRALRMFNCYIKGGGTRTLRSAFNSHAILDNCRIDAADTYCTESIVLLESEDNMLTNCLLTSSLGAGVRMEADSTAGQRGLWFLKNCTIEGCAGDGIEIVGTPATSTQYTYSICVTNSLIINNGGYGIDWGTQPISPLMGDIDYNCLFNNTSGNYNGSSAGSNDITITTSPFVDLSGGDYRLNTDQNGGALLKGAGRSVLPTGA